MRPGSDKSIKTGELLYFVITPLVFALLILAVGYFAVFPAVSPYISILDVLAKEVDDNSDGAEIVIYDPIKDRGTDITAPVTDAPNPVTENPDDPVQSGSQGGESGNTVLPVTSPNYPSSYVKFGSFMFPAAGVLYGRVVIPSAGIDCSLYMGDHRAVLDRGAGTSLYSHIPGDIGTTLVCAHATTFFHTLGSAVVGDLVYIYTNYGTYVYEISDTLITDASDIAALNLEADYENLVLYTCYPFSTLLSVTQRYYLYCRYVSGPVIDRSLP